MTARVRRTDPKPGSRNWRHIAICTECPWHGWKVEDQQRADRQAEKHNQEKHPDG